MDDQLRTLSKIFSEQLFRIPDYQRGYAWTDKQLKDFWNDIQQIGSNNNHYTGVLTLESVPKEIYSRWEDDCWIIEAKNYRPYFVVDGQQRLTTAIILIQVILEKVKDTDKLNFTDKKDIQRKFIFDSKDDGGISRSYLFGYERDNPSYEFLKTKIFNERSSTSLSQETIYTQNLAHSKQFFSDKIADLDHSEVSLLYKKVTQQLLFNLFTITEDVDVCVAFETMNNRGKPLSYLELLKNRLIYLSLKFDVADYERKKLRHAINDCWKSVYHNLGRNKEKPLDDDRFLHIHYITYFDESVSDETFNEDIAKSIAYRKLYQRLHRTLTEKWCADDLLEHRFVPRNVMPDAPKDKKITIKYIYDYVSSLQESVEIWYKMWNPFDSDFTDDVKIWLDKINRLNIPYSQPLILVFLQSEQSEKNRIAFLKAMERQAFILSLTNSSPFNSRHFSLSTYDIYLDMLNLAIDLRSKKSTAEKVTKHIIQEITKILQGEDFIKDISANLSSKGFYEWDSIRYFLFEYNLHLQSLTKTDRSKIYWPEFNEERKDFISVEHIYPRKAHASYWKDRFNDLTAPQRGKLRESLGNLLPLSKPKNSSLSNKPFPEKVASKKEPAIGYRFGCYAENEVAKENDWTPDRILQRGLRLLNFMEQRWDIKIGNNAQKKSMLGLDFMSD